MTIFSIMRSSLSMAMVAMVRENATMNHGQILLKPDKYKNDWTPEQQAQIFTTFYVTAFLALFITNYLCKKLGAKNTITIALVINIIGSLLTPFVAIFLRSYYWIAIVRAVMGLGFGVTIPACSQIISTWFPLSEKSTAMAIFTIGNQMGIALAMFFTAYLSELPWFGGWPFSFIASGILGFLFLVVWQIRAENKPRYSNYITATELEYIQGRRRRQRANTIVRPTPYKTNGIWSAVPFIVQIITKLLFASIADSLKRRNYSTNLITKISNNIASFGTALCMLGVAVVYSRWTWSLSLRGFLTTLLISCSMGLFSAYVPGYNTALVSVAPEFTAFVSSYAQLYGMAASTLSPYVIGYITNSPSVYSWKYVFYMLAGVLAVTGLIFQMFGHGETESWGEPASACASLRLSSTNQDDGNASSSRQISVQMHNQRLLDEGPIDPRSKKQSRVSYKDDESTPGAGLKLEDLENDVIYSIDEVEEKNSL
ncbi:hypothetical protein WR25_08241 [Diploscapter pachys]|uniref:Major facilitator superfamily (MFS) profile domain-containing protein n=1 Tax=Diploscapter pachys TaxID=2018661 RepID=A0A2A2LHL0_9BILA|nr:hypothetical protein WR25_08241 [Diploscapter pachys]